MSFAKLAAKNDGKKQGPKAWSHSAYVAHRNCPWKFYQERILKVRVPVSDALTNGIKKHDIAEKFLKSKSLKVPKALMLAVDDFTELKAMGATAEESWAFTRDWKPCKWNAKDVWLRMKIDAHLFNRRKKKRIIKLVDYKTGKPKENDDYKEQLELYGLGALLTFEDVDEVHAALWFIEHEETPGECVKVHSEVFKRSQVEELKRTWERRIKYLMKDTEFRPSPCWLCGGCYFNVNNGGPCKAAKNVQMWRTYEEKHNGVPYGELD